MKNRYQALKKYWVPDGPEAQAAMQESMGSEEDDTGEAAAPQQIPPQIPIAPINPTNPNPVGPPVDPSQAFRTDLPGTATASVAPPTASTSTEVPQSVQPVEETATAPGTSQPIVAVEKPEARRAWPVRESVTSPDGPLSHKFMVLQSRLHKASQLIARESDDLQVLMLSPHRFLSTGLYTLPCRRCICYCL